MFPPGEWRAAWHVVSHESAHQYDPGIKNFEGSDAWGLWQNRVRYWDDRVRRFFGDVEMNILDGWHSTLVAAHLAGTAGWHHFDTCHESDRAELQAFGEAYPFPSAIWCGAGRWL